MRHPMVLTQRQLNRALLEFAAADAAVRDVRFEPAVDRLGAYEPPEWTA